MAFDAFIKIEGIIGESTDASHTDWIDVLGFEIAATQPSTGGAGAGAVSSGRTELSKLVITKAVDLSSPVLFKSCTENSNITTVELQLCKATGLKQIYYRVELTDARVASISTRGQAKGANASPVPVEIIELAYSTILWEYTKTDHKTGAELGLTAHQWDTDLNITA